MQTLKYHIKTYNPQNRELHASRVLHQAEVIIQFSPIAWAILSPLRDVFCNYCLIKKTPLQRCSGCHTLYYCSVQCQKADWAMHKQECKRYGVLAKQKSVKITSEFILLVRCYLLYTSSKEIKGVLNELVDLGDKQSQQRREYFRDMSVCLIENFELERSTQTMGLLISLANKIAVNAFTIQDYLFDYDGVAVGVYHPANYVNHSCRPNAVQLFDGSTLKIMALTEIQQGEQITISYVDQLLQMRERKDLLRVNYLFECACHQCVAESIVKVEVIQLLCSGCQNNLQLKDNQHYCSKCARVYTENQIEQLKKQIKQLKSVLTKQGSSYDILIKSFFRLKKMLRFSSPTFQKILQNLYLAALGKSNLSQDPVNKQKCLEDAYKILKAYLDGFRKWHKMDQDQQFHVLLLWKYSQAGKLAMAIGKVKKAVTYTQRAMKILEQCKLSEKHQEVWQLKQRHNRLQIQCRLNVSGRS